MLAEANVVYRLLTKKPIFVGWNVTNRCTMRCAFCSVPAMAGKDMTPQEAGVALDAVARLGIPVVGITGGEPFLRPDLPELIAGVQDRGMKCTVVTNGDLFDRDKARSLAFARNIVHFALSVDSLDVATYAAFRGRRTLPETLLRYLDAIEHGPNCPYKLNIVLAPENVDEIDDILRFAGSAGLFVSFIPMNIAPGGFHRGKTYASLTPDARAKLSAAFARLRDAKLGGAPLWDHRDFYLLAADYVAGRSMPECRAGELFLDMRSDGKLAFCNELQHFADLLQVRDLTLADVRRARAEWGPRIERCRTTSACCYTCSYNIVATAQSLPAYVIDYFRLRYALPSPKAGARGRQA